MKKYCELLGFGIPEEECEETRNIDFFECQKCTGEVPVKEEGKERKKGSPRISKDGVKCGDCGKKASEDLYFRFNRGKCCKCISREDREKKKTALPAEKKKRTYSRSKPFPAPCPKEPVKSKVWEVPGTKRPGDELRITLDFTEIPEIYEELMALAKNEMRLPAVQILYLLKSGNFDALKH